ncbi:hypothetical protein OIU77_007222 [Salix suchowensis]|uniref:Uncharacterized protein n=1 Tax=Salix suchowensis TaxID=1278906 RepID=A0ABQ9AFC6_9ROSI|nr:hypothetical protein OIU77_007222 [Salix suchowensis]
MHANRISDIQEDLLHKRDEEVVNGRDNLITQKLAPFYKNSLPKFRDAKAESTLSQGVKNYIIALLCGTVHGPCNSMIPANPLLHRWNNLKTLASARLKAQFALDARRTSRAPSRDMRKS